ncbi:hypothetical protein EFS38_12990 [Dickeya undicola]|uniref:Uncharacterized protein n=1 Tax=Dickeya undicola TaxID=1577887 RepID=A0ABX9WT72_9GAMM|nr:hypothetical protein EFS38_12990 [Dickeya undicola]
MQDNTLVWALLNKSNFQVIGGSDRYLRFNHQFPCQSKSPKSPTGPHTTQASYGLMPVLPCVSPLA